MINDETVFILGAGASVPYGYPTGIGLREDIINSFKEDFQASFIPYESDDRDMIYNVDEFIKVFRKSPKTFIDLFLARNPGFSNLGKMAIANSILKAEQKSGFDLDISKKFKDQDWYSYLFKIMTKELKYPDSYDQFQNNRVSFINFNYDRSLEFFICNSFINAFFNEIRSRGLIRDLKKLIPFPFLHVYGKICETEFCGGPGYKFKFEWRHINGFSENIRVIHERTGKDIEEINNLISRAKRIFFLGFGYDPENLKTIGLPDNLKYEQTIFGTALNWTQKQIIELKHSLAYGSTFPPDLKSFYEQLIKIKDTNCYSLLREYLY